MTSLYCLRSVWPFSPLRAARVDMTEMEAILHTLNKEVGNYPFLLSCRQADKLCGMADALEAIIPPGQRQQVASARKIINAKRNLTAEIDSLNEQDQEYLNRNFWKITHDPVVYAETQFTARGEHYSGNEQKGYLEVRGDAVKGFEAETTLKNLRPGRYRVSAVVRASRAEHSNVYIFVKTGNGNLCTKEIPAMGNTGGNVWFSALCRFEQRIMTSLPLSTSTRPRLMVDRALAGTASGWMKSPSMTTAT